MRTASILPLLLAWLAVAPALADEAKVVDVAVTKVGEGRYRFAVTLSHPDTGWEHYANAWHVEASDGIRLGTRVLAHPHVDEQPFTRSATIGVPAGTRRVLVRAEDLVHGLSKTAQTVELPTE